MPYEIILSPASRHGTGSRPRVLHRAVITAATPGDARHAALREWFGAGCFWDSDEDSGPREGRVCRVKEVTRNGRVRFKEEALTKTVRITIRRKS